MEQIKLLKEPYKTGAKKNSPFVFTVDDGSKNGIECDMSELQRLSGIHRSNISHRLSLYGWDSPEVFTRERCVKHFEPPKELTGLNVASSMRYLRNTGKYYPALPMSLKIKCTEKGWAEACDNARRNKTSWGELGEKWYCAKCKGKDIPPGVEFYTDEEFTTLSKQYLEAR